MDWNEFYKSVKSGDLLNVYLFSGPEELNKREALAALRKSILPAGLEQLNDATLENCSAQAIIDSAETMPVMCERRLVVVRDWPPLTPGNAKNAESDVSRMLEWLKDVPESCILVFYMTKELGGSKKLADAIRSAGTHVKFDHLSGQLLEKWCKQKLKQDGKKIADAALSELLMMVGQDLTLIDRELKKLVAYTEDAPEITIADVRAVVSPSPEYSVFMILDLLLEGKLFEATQVVNSVLMTEFTSVGLIGMLANQLRIDALFKNGLEAGRNSKEILRDINVLEARPISDGRAWHIQRQIRSIPAQALEDRYQHCVAADYDIKSGRTKDRAALDALMLKITMPQKATR